MIDQKALNRREKPNTRIRLKQSDLEQIVNLAELHSHPQLTKTPIPSRAVVYAGHKYKVRAYSSDEEARQRVELIEKARCLFAQCHGKAGRYLVMEYIEGTRASGDDPMLREQILDRLPCFLQELAAIPTNDSLEDDFNFLLGNIAVAGIFQPCTIELIGRYYSQAQALSIMPGLEYYDAMPRNFVLTEEGKLVSIDEKHLRIGPRGVSLIKPMEQLSASDFSRLKAAYLAGLSSVPFDDPEYRRFLTFYRHLTALGVIGSRRARQINMYERDFHVNRHVLLRTVGASPSARIREEIAWTRYWLHQIESRVRRAPGFLKRRVMRAVASVRHVRGWGRWMRQANNPRR